MYRWDKINIHVAKILKWVYLRKQKVFWCLHALLWICGYIILNYFNIHCCGLGESFMSVLGFCTLRTAWQLVSYITTSQPHTHICTHTHANTCTCTHTHIHMQKCKCTIIKGHTNIHKNINIQTTNPHLFFQWNYLIPLLLEVLYFSPLITFSVNMCVISRYKVNSAPTLI